MWEIITLKLAVLLGTDKRAWKLVGAVVALLLSPMIFCVSILLLLGNARIKFNPASLETLDSTYESPVVVAARTRIGDPYSQDKRGIDNYVDCSYLTQWAYQQVGINIPNTAAGQGQYIDDNFWTVEKMELRSGDLIFYSYEPNGRYKDITHVAIYSGADQVVHASSSKGEVVECRLFDEDKIVLMGRPFKN